MGKLFRAGTTSHYVFVKSLAPQGTELSLASEMLIQYKQLSIWGGGGKKTLSTPAQAQTVP